MDLACSISELPVAAAEEVVAAFRNESDHQTEIGETQVEDQHVGRSAQRRIRAEDLQHDEVSRNRAGTYYIANQSITDRK